MKRWIVIEWNQASGQPAVASGTDLFWTEGNAEDCAEQLRRETAAVGRRERYSVHEIDLELS